MLLVAKRSSVSAAFKNASKTSGAVQVREKESSEREKLGRRGVASTGGADSPKDLPAKES